MMEQISQYRDASGLKASLAQQSIFGQKQTLENFGSRGRRHDQHERRRQQSTTEMRNNNTKRSSMALIGG
jgi:hypothetical protein